ncbi:hypothetical protein [uncultured Tenacibaculum sp.]|uniref:hypothetical protein n=1 Tax=uncultured Tenacibaculum sp. TaxID=174713 RepID=UPI002626AB78|nr:hypothetical protein [uncultured Tenacibaculum sp.]
MNYYVLFADLRVKGLATVMSVPNGIEIMNTMTGEKQPNLIIINQKLRNFLIKNCNNPFQKITNLHNI